MSKYSLFQLIFLVYYKLRGYFVFKNARLIRFPFRVRGKKNIKVGKGFTTGFNCRLDAFDFHQSKEKYLLEIGDNVEINDNVHISAVEKVMIEDNVLIASKVYISDHNHGSYSGLEQDSPLSIPKERKIYTQPVHIKKNVWLGQMVSVLQGVTIGEGSIIGAMSVVTKDIPPYSIAVGTPAKVIKQYNFETKKWEKI